MNKKDSPLGRLALALMAAAAVLILSPAPGRATVIENLSLEQMVELSGYVVTGTILSAQARWTDDGAMIHTYVELEVDVPVKGRVFKGEIITLRYPGGRVGDTVAYVAGIPRLAPGDEVLLFLDRIRDGYSSTIGWELGSYALQALPGTGTTMARHLGLSTGVAKMGRHNGTDPPQTISVEAFISKIRKIAEAQAARGREVR